LIHLKLASGSSDLVGVTIAAYLLRSVIGRAGNPKTARKEGVADLFAHQVGFPGQERFIYFQYVTGNDCSVHDYLVSRPEQQHIPFHYLGRVYLFLALFADNGHFRPGEESNFVQLPFRADFLCRAHKGIEQNQGHAEESIIVSTQGN